MPNKSHSVLFGSPEYGSSNEHTPPTKLATAHVAMAVKGEIAVNAVPDANESKEVLKLK